MTNIEKTIKEITNVEKKTIQIMKVEKSEDKEFKNYMLILEHRIQNILINNYSNSYDDCVKYMVKGKIRSLITFYMTDKIFKYDYFSLKADLINDLNVMINKELKLRETKEKE